MYVSVCAALHQQPPDPHGVCRPGAYFLYVRFFLLSSMCIVYIYVYVCVLSCMAVSTSCNLTPTTPHTTKKTALPSLSSTYGSGKGRGGVGAGAGKGSLKAYDPSR